MKAEITWQTAELDYPMRKMRYGDGLVVDEYIIPEEDKRDILEALYPFTPIPEMDEIFEDVWSNTEFMIRDFRVVKADYGLKLISPAGGAVEDWWKKESEEEREFSCLVDINYDAGYRDAMEGCRYGTHKYSRRLNRSVDFNNGICSAYDDGYSWGMVARGCLNPTRGQCEEAPQEQIHESIQKRPFL